MKNKQRRKIGQIIKVPLERDRFSIGVVLREPLIAFCNKLIHSDTEIDYQFSQDGIAFIVMVMNYAITSGRWPVVGQISVPDWMTIPPKFCKIDERSGVESIYQEIEELAPNYERPAMAGECVGLEVAAVWEPEHVEDRLRDYFKGIPNKWVEQLRKAH